MRTFNAKSNGSGIMTMGFAAKLVRRWNLGLFWGAVALPVFLSFVEPGVLGEIWKCFYWAALITVLIVIFSIVRKWGQSDDSIVSVVGKFVRPVPFGLVYGSDLKSAGVPVVTISLIVANTILFFITPREIVDQLCVLPFSEINMPRILLTTVGGVFLHANFSHLIGNMIFLWAIGVTLELKIGRGRFIAVYVLCGVISSLISLNLLIYQIQVYDDPLLMLRYNSIGASAAVSGLMGLFVVRCYSTRLSFSLPIPFNPLFAFPLRINGILLIGLFIANDLAGRMVPTPYGDVMTGDWGHVGGFMGGLILGLAFNLQAKGNSEVREDRAQRRTPTVACTSKASKLYRDMLGEEPDNLTALQRFLKLNRYNDEKEGGNLKNASSF